MRIPPAVPILSCPGPFPFRPISRRSYQPSLPYSYFIPPSNQRQVYVRLRANSTKSTCLARALGTTLAEASVFSLMFFDVDLYLATPQACRFHRSASGCLRPVTKSICLASLPPVTSLARGFHRLNTAREWDMPFVSCLSALADIRGFVLIGGMCSGPLLYCTNIVDSSRCDLNANTIRSSPVIPGVPPYYESARWRRNTQNALNLSFVSL